MSLCAWLSIFRNFGIAVLLCATMQPANASGTALPLTELAKPGRVLMLRHATAPGTGDPPGFVLGDCTTQRNLDAAGQAQAIALGKRLARAGLTQIRIFSSQWCRCLETAGLLKLGPVIEMPALNSFFDQPQHREKWLSELRSFLAGLPVDGAPVILVTHQVTINSFTDTAVPSAGGSIFQLNGSGLPTWLGRMASD